MKNRLKAIFALLVLAAALWALQARHGSLPPLATFLDPVNGFWRNNAASDAIPETLSIAGLRGQVTVVWDDRHVPHIFAANEDDLYRAQGYLTARDRLWQMDFLSRYAGGRLAEVIGPRVLEMDLLQRRLGMTWGAENFLKGIAGDAAMRRILTAYCNGVNAYVDALKPAAYPVEYKILGYAPSRWTPFDIALLLKYMAWDLTGYGNELGLTRTRQAAGEAVIDALFPFFAPFQDPVIPAGTAWAPAPSPPVPSRNGAARPGAGPVAAADPFGEPVGSNNWVVAGKKTKSGFPILCDDPHLQLTLPSIWYEVQLSAPGLNVRGVSLPGAPGVVIGFNEKIAWGVTNAGSDVLDFFQLRFRDSRQREYAWGETWRPLTWRREEIRVRGNKTVVENVPYTHLGPLPFAASRPGRPDWIPEGAAMRWTGHDASAILDALYRLNRARGYEDFKAAIAGFDCPAQNFAYAGSDGRIAIWHNGKFPLRARGQGRYLLDGSDPQSEWAGWVPMDRVPHSEDPERGFVSSANQSPTGDAYPYYLGWDYGTFERGRRINELLETATGISGADMARMQGDALSLRARTILPRLLAILNTAPLTAVERERAEGLARWDFVHRAESTEPTVFSRFFVELYKAIWDDDLERGGKLFLAPKADVTMDLILGDAGSPFFDDAATPEKESLADIVVRAFRRALALLQEERGAFSPRWRWGQANPVVIGHLGRIPGLGAPALAVSGGRGVINAASGGHGPSWRMVVELGPGVKAWGSLPGGAAGNPGSRFYDDGVRDWAAGRAVELLFLRSAAEAHPRIAARTSLRGKR
ncbi:MAG: penicillin acylase family protein [Acidobacteria bacterium]|nr:penicillin acylase family protein [Acidobacteriota bacterium]